MRFTKPPLSFTNQADLLIKRGLTADKTNLIKVLQKENYYHLSGYLYTYRQRGHEEYQPGTNLGKILEIMAFDSELRCLVFKVISVLERWIRTNLVYYFTIHYNDPFAYIKPTSFPWANTTKFNDFIGIIRNEMNHSREQFVLHYKRKYSQENYMPAWMAAEVMSMGTMNRFYQLMDRNIKSNVVNVFNVKESEFHSWLNCLRYVRNLCAHHNRLWNRLLSINPRIPADQRFSNPTVIRNDRLFGILSVMSFMYSKLDIEKKWVCELNDLFLKYQVKIGKMGFPNNWQSLPLWK